MDLPGVWTSGAADIDRDERKREQSPSSFFFSQGRALVLAARYFCDSRLVESARRGSADKHLHRIYLALFGQMMASLEFLLKDFLASVVDTVPIYDDAILRAKWIVVDAGRVLSFRSSSSTPGTILLHSTQGWFDPVQVNSRYSQLIEYEPILATEFSDLQRLWILRHSVAHNAGFITPYDATRGGMPDLAGRVARIDGTFIEESFDFLCTIARRIAEQSGDKVLVTWLKTKTGAGQDYRRDQLTYLALKHLAAFVPSRTQELPTPSESDYARDFTRAAVP